ncbi:hypothetical protein DENSPDRAFT_191694 [Dentipellis sp. KUC8613]|nr:hypothetical protein DENSPDRAFT_191694 [Dentipellis sp. KUC8613]
MLFLPLILIPLVIVHLARHNMNRIPSPAASIPSLPTSEATTSFADCEEHHADGRVLNTTRPTREDDPYRPFEDLRAAYEAFRSSIQDDFIATDSQIREVLYTASGPVNRNNDSSTPMLQRFLNRTSWGWTGQADVYALISDQLDDLSTAVTGHARGLENTVEEVLDRTIKAERAAQEHVSELQLEVQKDFQMRQSAREDTIRSLEQQLAAAEERVLDERARKRGFEEQLSIAKACARDEAIKAEARFADEQKKTQNATAELEKTKVSLRASRDEIQRVQDKRATLAHNYIKLRTALNATQQLCDERTKSAEEAKLRLAAETKLAEAEERHRSEAALNKTLLEQKERDLTEARAEAARHMQAAEAAKQKQASIKADSEEQQLARYLAKEDEFKMRTKMLKEEHAIKLMQQKNEWQKKLTRRRQKYEKVKKEDLERFENLLEEKTEKCEFELEEMHADVKKAQSETSQAQKKHREAERALHERKEHMRRAEARWNAERAKLQRERDDLEQQLQESRQRPANSTDTLAVQQAYRAAYNCAWTGGHHLTFKTFCWPVASPPRQLSDITQDAIEAFVLDPAYAHGASEVSRVRKALLIWHPDKIATVWPNVAREDQQQVGAALALVARSLNNILSEVSKPKSK